MDYQYGRLSYTAEERSPGAARRSADAPVANSDAPAILVVEDQADVRRMLVTALEIEGYRVAEAHDAAAGLQQLRQSRFKLVLSDYSMPGQTGAWMLQEAARQGLLDRTAALIVTAHPDVQRMVGVEVLSKPIDLDLFLEQVRRIVAHDEPGDDGRSARAPAQPVELVLYISSASVVSAQARRMLEQVLASLPPSKVQYTVCDLVKDPLAGEADRVVFTPTLVKRFPEPRVWMVGNPREPRAIIDLLRTAGVDVEG
jgi:CheY-like chemotaxis protein